MPSPASWALPAAPIQYTVSPRGVVDLMTGSALCRFPRRVTLMPVSSSYSTSGTFTFNSTGCVRGCLTKRATSSAATRPAVRKCPPPSATSDIAIEGMPRRKPSVAAATVPE